VVSVEDVSGQLEVSVVSVQGVSGQCGGVNGQCGGCYWSVWRILVVSGRC